MGLLETDLENSPATGSVITETGARKSLLFLLVALALATAAACFALLLWQDDIKTSEAQAAAERQEAALPPLPAPNLLKPLTPEDAQAANAERPLVKLPIGPAASFRLTGDAVSRLRAIECLTQAIYYEAASEGADGGRAVAQVVLNRLRHPGYPNSVCGVVYQGSERTTGCQFSFTCDGSLSRLPSSYLWTRSRTIAREALSGRVFEPVGHATHYHADYVLPYWADSLDKIRVIGRHIFYRLRGRIGSRSAFTQRYAAIEPAPPPPPPPSSVQMIEEGLSAQIGGMPDTFVDLVPKVEEDRVGRLELNHSPRRQQDRSLHADLARGELLLGEPSYPKREQELQSENCKVTGVDRIKPMTANDLKALGDPVC